VASKGISFQWDHIGCDSFADLNIGSARFGCNSIRDSIKEINVVAQDVFRLGVVYRNMLLAKTAEWLAREF